MTHEEQRAKLDDDLNGTFACPICGLDKPHHHPDEQVAAYREDQVRRDGWTSVAHRQPKESGWYLCLGIEVDPDQYGKKKDFWTPNERWSQLSWFRWVRNAGATPQAAHHHSGAGYGPGRLRRAFVRLG